MSNYFRFPCGRPNSLSPKFINECNKDFLNHAKKKSPEFLVWLSWSKSENSPEMFLKCSWSWMGMVLKCSLSRNKNHLQTIFGEGIYIMTQFLVDYYASKFFPQKFCFFILWFLKPITLTQIGHWTQSKYQLGDNISEKV